MYLYRSNRSECLVERLAKLVRDSRDPLEAETIVVQSRGMERWLAMQLSDRLGVWANADFPFPRTLIERAATAALGEAEGAAAFGEEELTWSIASVLPPLLGEPDFAPLARYLHTDADGSLRIQLAQRIASTFDDYLVYRPDWIADWEAGQGEGWEPRLWRELVRGREGAHPGARLRALIEALQRPGIELPDFPHRACLFGIAALPPLLVHALAALSRHVELHLFVLTPSAEYWGDTRRRSGEGHCLLASLGALGRDFQDVLLDDALAPHIEEAAELHEDPGQDTLLTTLQSDMLNLRNRGAAGDPTPRLEIAPEDCSISIHACHGPMREVEVLHDQLVAVLEDSSIDPPIAPEDIIVMTPDIEGYAPAIEAVFGQRSGRPRLPFSVSYRRPLARSALADAFDALLTTLRGRMTASEVIDLLSAEPIRARFDIAADELQSIRTWVEESGIRWGIDGSHRVAEGLPDYPENTWRFGLDRMLLGYAMHGGGTRLFEGHLPYDELEGGAAELLGKLVEFCEQLFAQRERVHAPRTLARWRDDLTAVIQQLTRLPPSGAHEMQELRQRLVDLAERAERAGFDEPVPLSTVRAQLEATPDSRMPTRGFLSGGITFCQLVPLRSIPFRMVCLLGLSDELFPRGDVRVGFHRMAAPTEHRRGDRSPRDDDRYMFLEALLSARDRLLISYVGQGIHDNRVMPPSVVVGELLDSLHQGFRLPGAEPATDAAAAGFAAGEFATAGPAGDGSAVEDAREGQARARLERRLRTDHRLHAFSTAYYEPEQGPGRRLFSYAEHYCAGARSMGREHALPPFLVGALGKPPAELQLRIDQLWRWVGHPLRAFFQDRLGVNLGDDITPLRDREPMELAALDRWKVGSELLKAALGEAADVEGLLPAVRAAGTLPLGTVGQLVFDDLGPEVIGLAACARDVCEGPRMPMIPVDLEHDGIRIVGGLDEVFPGGQVHVTFSRGGKRRELEHWVRHLVLCCVREREGLLGHPGRSMVISNGKNGPELLVFEAPERPFELLSELLQLVRAAHVQALPFAYETSRAYADICLVPEADPNDAELDRRALRAGHTAFYKTWGDLDDAYVAKVYGDFEALLAAPGPAGVADGFRSVTRTILRPMLAHARRGGKRP